MNKHTQPLNKKEALVLQIDFPNVLAYNPLYDGENPAKIETWNIEVIYEKNDKVLYVTREDYAMYVSGNKPLPEGYGYANYPLDSGRYEGLSFKHWNTFAWDSRLSSPEWEHSMYGEFHSSFPSRLGKNELVKWYEVAFKLEDLARVEEEPLATLNQAGEPALKPENENFEEIAERFKHTDKEDETSKEQPYEDLEAQIETLQSTLILQKSKAKVLISYYKDRSKLDQAIAKLEEELTNG